MNKFLALLLLFPLVLTGSPEDLLLSKQNRMLLSPLQEVIQSSSVTISDDQNFSIGYGCLVSTDGHILTKASLIENRTQLHVRLDKTRYPVTVEQTSLSWDVALLKIPLTEGSPLKLESSSPKIGEIIISNGVTSLLSRRLKFGIISAHARPIPLKEASIDLEAYTRDDDGKLYIKTTKPNGSAEQAGLQAEDQIISINGVAVTDLTKSLDDYFEGLWPGTEVSIEIRRSEGSFAYSIPLLWRQEISEGPQDRNEAMSGRISTRRTGFPMVLQHDIALSSRTVGGPLLNLSGDCIGMNIARFSRSETYAIPAESMQQLLQEWGIK